MQNTMIESKIYKGVRYKKLSDGDISYYIRFTKDGKQIQKKVGTKFGGWSEKLAFNKKIELEHNFIDQKPITFKEVVERFLKIKKLHLRKESFKSYIGRVKHLEYFNDKRIDEVTQKDLNNLIIGMKEKFANKTINQIITITKQIMKFADEEYNITNQNLSKIQNLKIDNARERFLTKEEVLLLKQALQAKPELLLFVNLALCTGARLMSVYEIRKKDIDLEKETIILKDFKNSSTYQGYLNEETKELLLKKWDKLKDDDRVIQRNKKVIAESLRAILHKLFNQNNPDNKQKVVIHTLRHTFASHLAIAGTPIQIIQKLLNHRDIQMTMRYSHLMPDSGKEWVKKIWDK